MGKTIHVQYYAILREQRGVSNESIETNAETAADLYGELASAHRFTLDRGVVRAAVNAEFAPWDQSLNDGDTVVFVPPVAGG